MALSLEILPPLRSNSMKKGFFGVAVLGLVLAAGNAWAADDATGRCQEYAREDGVSAEEMKDYMEQCIEDQRMASAGSEQAAEDNADEARVQSD
jgi:hypothetical protein